MIQLGMGDLMTIILDRDGDIIAVDRGYIIDDIEWVIMPQGEPKAILYTN